MQASRYLHSGQGLTIVRHMVSKDRILDAAARVYAEHGFRGATTRRIADVAGVNEVTIFRIFGSKAKLMDEAVSGRLGSGQIARLPDVPADPEAEMTAWVVGQLAFLRGRRDLIRRTLGDLEKGPAFGQCASEGAQHSLSELRRYLASLASAGLITADRDLASAPAMIMGTIFADAMARELQPDIFPRPMSAAPRVYARLFLRAIGLRQRGERNTIRRRKAPAAKLARRPLI